MKKIHKIAKKIDDNLRADDLRLSHVVHLVHEDGSIFHWDNAFLIEYYDKDHPYWGGTKYPGQWVFVFSEHHGFHVFARNEVENFRQFKRVSVEKHPDFPEDQWICDSCHSTFIEPSSAWLADSKIIWVENPENLDALSLCQINLCPWCESDTVRVRKIVKKSLSTN